jgi:hypothetical protein
VQFTLKEDATVADAAVRLDPELKRDFLLRASEDKDSVSELIRRVLRRSQTGEAHGVSNTSWWES